MRTLASSILLLIAFAAHAQQPIDVDELIDRMTLEEKLGQLSQYTEDEEAFKAAIAKGNVGSILNAGPAAHIEQLQREQLEHSRLKIPMLVGYDVIHGFHTIFPIPLAIASSWDPRMAELSATVAAREAREAGIHWTFAPMVDIARDARWGRIAEGAGEDPVLGSAMAAAYVHGFQQHGLLACAKHFAAYGAAEAGRDYNRAEMSEETLREVYLPPFRAAVDAHVATVMSAFDSLNGVPATANHHLLDDVLRRDWHFAGFVVSDWDAVAELMNHRIAATKEEAARKAITAGVDMDMWDGAYATLVAEVRAGRLPVSVVDRAVKRVLQAKVRAGLFGSSAPRFLGSSEDADAAEEPRNPMNPRNELARAEARQVADESIVLLRNEHDLLPLPKSGKSIAVIGPLADSRADMLGPWAAKGNGDECVAPLEGIRAVVPGARFANGDDINAAVDLARSSDVVIAVLGETRDMSGEASSRASLDLPGNQEPLLEALVATGKPVVLVVVSGRPLAIAWAAAHVPAILQSWFLGSEAGHALADVLFGDVNPSAKLPVTIPRATGQVPIYYAQLPTGRPANPDDKYTSKYLDLPIGPLYPFGFGLSYTRFDYSDLTLSRPSMHPDGSITVSANVRNAGTRSGDEIVQLYVRDPVMEVSRPVKELEGFQRVALRPGESRRVAFTIARHELELWSNGHWIVAPGECDVWIGPSSANGLEGKFMVKR